MNNKGETTINRKHDYYFQIQRSIRSYRQKLLFICRMDSGLQKASKQKKIRDKNFFKDVMLKKLIDFYVNYLLPEIINNSAGRNMELRD